VAIKKILLGKPCSYRAVGYLVSRAYHTHSYPILFAWGEIGESKLTCAAGITNPNRIFTGQFGGYLVHITFSAGDRNYGADQFAGTHPVRHDCVARVVNVP